MKLLKWIVCHPRKAVAWTLTLGGLLLAGCLFLSHRAKPSYPLILFVLYIASFQLKL